MYTALYRNCISCTRASFEMELYKNLNPTTPSSVPMIIAAIASILPWPNGCLLSAGFPQAQKPATTIIDVRLSDNVCQASATMATDATANPTHSFKAKSTVLVMIEIHPTAYPSWFLDNPEIFCIISP